MNFFKSFTFFFVLLVFSAQAHAQGVAVNLSGSSADSSAMLDVSSTSKGMLVPRMTSIERDAIISPAEGLLIFNTTTSCFNFYRSGYWFEMCGNCISPPVPSVSYNGPLCEGDTLKLFSSAVPGATYSWTGPFGFSSGQQNPIVPNVSTFYSGSYQLTVSFPGCTSNPVSLGVTVNAIPSSLFTFLPDPAMVGQNCTFTPATTGVTYSWTFQGATTGSSTQQSPVVQWNTVGSYPVSLTASNGGCSSTSYDTVDVVSCPPGQTTFSFTGSVQTFVVPACVTLLYVDARGAQGGGSSGGAGGRARASIPVTPGETLLIYVGGQPTAQSGAGSGGWNGGGDVLALPCGGSSDGWPGGGASDVRRTVSLSTRLIVGGGGGGQGYSNGNGGAGGGLTGGDGAASWISGTQGHGGTQTSGGTGGVHTSGAAPNGVLGTGGDAGPQSGYCAGGAGGGGYYGGGGGYVSSGAGGSSYIDAPGNTNKSTTPGFQSGNGVVIISW